MSDLTPRPAAPSADGEAPRPPSAAPEAAAGPPARETSPALAEQVARRVYELLLADLRRDLERHGRRW